MRKRKAREWALDIGTAAIVLTAVALLVQDRVLPAWQAREVVDVGETVPADLRFRTVPGGDTISLVAPGSRRPSGPAGAGSRPAENRRGGAGPALVFVYQSTCPACERNLPAWRAILDEAPAGVSAWGVALEPPESALAYLREHLTPARLLRPLERDRFLRVFAITSVPTTLLLDGRGRLRIRRAGVLAAAETDSILRLAALAASR